MEEDLELSSRQFEWLIWAFYITYIGFEWMTLMSVYWKADMAVADLAGTASFHRMSTSPFVYSLGASSRASSQSHHPSASCWSSALFSALEKLHSAQACRSTYRSSSGAASSHLGLDCSSRLALCHRPLQECWHGPSPDLPVTALSAPGVSCSC